MPDRRSMVHIVLEKISYNALLHLSQIWITSPTDEDTLALKENCAKSDIMSIFFNNMSGQNGRNLTDDICNVFFFRMNIVIFWVEFHWHLSLLGLDALSFTAKLIVITLDIRVYTCIIPYMLINLFWESVTMFGRWSYN